MSGDSMNEMIQVPSPEASWSTIWTFALTYNAYDRYGDFDAVATIGNGARDEWSRRGCYPDVLGTARTVLFFEQRRYRHFGEDPTGADADYVRGLVAHIAALSGGAVPGPSDPWP